MDAQLQELIALQKEQNALLRKNLWRLKFSLLTLLFLTTAICCCLGFIIYVQQDSRPQIPTSATAASPLRAYSPPATRLEVSGDSDERTIYQLLRSNDAVPDQQSAII